MPEVELFVGLKIPDTTAITTFHTLEKIGYKQLKKVKRELYYKFEIDGNKDEFIEQISKVDILVNANKNNFRTELEKEDNAVRILVKETDDNCESLLNTLKNRLGFAQINKIEKGVLWTLHEVDKQTAEDITKKLLYNEHYQDYSIL